MASIPVVIVGTIKDNDSDEEKQVTITGMASLKGLSVGGGPMPGGPPLGFWGGYRPPYIDNTLPMPQPPLGFWGGVAPPFVDIGFPMPQPPGDGDREPKFEWKTGWSPETGWVVVAIPQFEHVTPSK
jgi:hypothetical protein